jgi:hypothetical protein
MMNIIHIMRQTFAVLIMEWNLLDILSITALPTKMCLLMVKKCTEAAVDAVVMEVRKLVTVAVMGVQAAASMGGGVGGGKKIPDSE